MARTQVLIGISAIALVLASACGGNGTADPDAGTPDDAQPPVVDASPSDASPPADASVATSCNLVDQSGCNPSQKCSIIPSSPVRIGCVANQGSVGLYQSCAVATMGAPDLCAKGLVCHGQTTPVCQEFCDDAPSDTCSGAQSCLFEFDIDGDFSVDYQLCGASCDLLAQDCIAGHGCYPSLGGEVCAEEGAGETPVAEGGLCPFANSCEAGAGCFRLGASPDWLCFKICVPGGTDCSGSQVCNPVAGEAWGLCIDAS